MTHRLPRTLEAIKAAGMDPNTVLQDGITQEGYLKLRPGKDGGDFTPWPTLEVGKKAWEAYEADVAAAKRMRPTLPAAGVPVMIGNQKVGEVRSVSFDSAGNAYATVMLDGHDFGTSVSLNISREEIIHGDQ